MLTHFTKMACSETSLAHTHTRGCGRTQINKQTNQISWNRLLLLLHYLAHLLFILPLLVLLLLLLLSFSHLFYSFNKLRSSEACSNALESSARSLQLDENKVNRRHSAHSHAHTHAFTQKRTKSSYINCNFRELCCLVFVRFVPTHFSSQIFFSGKRKRVCHESSHVR